MADTIIRCIKKDHVVHLGKIKQTCVLPSVFCSKI